MARIDASGIDFSDGTELNSKYDIIPQNSVMVFYETSAPGGWTKVTSHDNKALRVVSGTGGGFGSGGTAGPGGSPFTNVMTTRPFSGTFTATGTIGATTLTTQQIPSHSHNAGSSVTVSPGSPGVQGRRVNGQAPATSSTGGGQSHTHPFAGNPAPYSGSLDLRVQYIDVILCQFN